MDQPLGIGNDQLSLQLFDHLPAVLYVEDLVRELRTSKHTVYRLLSGDDAAVPSVMVGSRKAVLKADFVAYITGGRVQS